MLAIYQQHLRIDNIDILETLAFANFTEVRYSYH